jgi:uncharacterized protein with PQ loop repeat
MSSPLFGLLIIERDPYTFANFLGLLQAWLQDAGGFAALGLVAYLVYALRTPTAQAASAKDRAGVSGFMLLMAVLSLLFYAVYAAILIVNYTSERNFGVDQVNRVFYNSDPTAFVKHVPHQFSPQLLPLLLTAGGLCALLGIGQPFVASLFRIRFRRLWALTRLAFKESIRNKLVWAFLVFLIPFLFPITWFIPTKPENELRLTVVWTSAISQFLLLFVSALIGSFAIPTDVKNQNIYTIVTKPVERFEIVLGRFLGYLGLMSLALLAMTALSWVFIYTTKLDDKAKEETYRARMPVRGKLAFSSRKGDMEGVNVGREFDYRKYIAGDPTSSQRAIWSFNSVPSGLTRNRDHVPCEFTFDIFRLTKGEENRGVDVTVRVVSWQCKQKPPTDPRDGTWRWADPAQEQAYKDDARKWVADLGVSAQNPEAVLAQAKPGTPAWEVVNRLAEKYGYYEIAGREIFDYHPETIAVPVGVFQNAVKESPKAEKDQPAPPAVQVYVKCQSAGQMLGMAEGDLYFLEGDGWFGINYFKASFGLWCRVALVLGLAVCLSTYLAGVISFLGTLFLYLAGYATDHLMDMASGRSAAGGPATAMNKLLRAEMPTAPSDPGNPLTGALDVFDVAFAWIVRRFINLVPDVHGFSWTDYLKEGFDVPPEYLVMNFLVTAAYLLPWFILGYYLMRSREVAA